MAPLVLGLIGAKGAGKDSVAQIIIDHDPNFVRRAFGDRIKAMALALDPLICVTYDEYESWTFSELPDDAHPRVIGEGDSLNQECMWLRLSSAVALVGMDQVKLTADGRRLLQRFGTEVGRMEIGDNFWIDNFHTHVSNTLAAGRSVVITDARFENEVQYVRSIGGQVWQVDRPEVEDGDQHASEQAWRSIEPDRVIPNGGSFEELKHHVLSALRETRESRDYS